MQTSIVIDGKKHKLRQSDTLGVGGEATVVQVNGNAVKLFHKPTSDRAKKLQDFLKLGKLPRTVCSPQKLAYDSSGRRIVGYVMQRLSPQYEVVQMLSSKKFRRQHPSITLASITDLMLSGYETIEQLHKAGVIIGDNSDLNVLFWQSKMVYIDADSFQFGQYPCVVGTENFLDPQLYDKDLGSKPYFVPLHDWYSWFVMAIRSLLMVHPYGGVHRDYKTVPQRAKARITFYDPSVKYPKSGMHPDLLNDGLKAMFDRMFAQGERFIPPKDEFVEYRDSLTTCLSCGAMHPAAHSSCPQCSHVNTQRIQRQVKVVKRPGKRTVNCEAIMTTCGHIIWRHVLGQTIHVIAHEGVDLVLYRYSPNDRLKSMKLMSLAGDPVFELFGGKYLAYSDGTSDRLTVFDISGNSPVDTAYHPWVDSFQGRRVFVGSRDHLFRVHQGFLFASEYYGPQKMFLDKNINAVSRNQTWLAASPHGSVLFCCQRFFETLKFFIYRLDQKKLWYSPITELEENESILDASIRFSATSILLILKTEIKGKTFVHVYVLHADEVKSHFRVDAISSDTYKNIHGKGFAATAKASIILHPTDDGIVQEKIENHKSQTFLWSETEPFVSDSDTLDQYRDGILVTGDQGVNYLTLT